MNKVGQWEPGKGGRDGAHLSYSPIAVNRNGVFRRGTSPKAKAPKAPRVGGRYVAYE